MRQAFVHEAVLVMEPGADEGAPGASVTVALCGHWEHDPPCPLAPHHVRADLVGDELRVRVLFAAEPEDEREVRRRIVLALSGHWRSPRGFTKRWEMRDSWPEDVSERERRHADRLIRG